MARLTTDPNDPDLKYGGDEAPVAQNKAYLVLSQADIKRGYVQPVRRSYLHTTCNSVTSMSQAIAQTYAADPWFYGATYCVQCSMHRPLAEFVWHDDGEPMSPAKWTPDLVERHRRAKAEIEARKTPPQPQPHGPSQFSDKASPALAAARVAQTNTQQPPKPAITLEALYEKIEALSARVLYLESGRAQQ